METSHIKTSQIVGKSSLLPKGFQPSVFSPTAEQVVTSSNAAEVKPQTLEMPKRKYVRKTIHPVLPFDPKKKWAVAKSDNIEWLKAQKAGSFQTIILDPPFGINFKYNTFKDNMPHAVYVHQQLIMLYYAWIALKEGGSIFYYNYPGNAAEVWAGATFLNRYSYNHWIYRSQCRSLPVRKGTRHVLWLTKGKPLVHLEALQTNYRSTNDRRVKALIAEGRKPQMHDWAAVPQVGNMNRERRNHHPCQMPSEIIERAILATSNPGDLVGDCYLGSGTSAFAALKLGRRFAGCDMDEMYVQKANDLLKKQFGVGEAPELESRTTGNPIASLDLTNLPAMKTSHDVLVVQEAITPTQTTEVQMNKDILSLTEITSLGSREIPSVVKGLLPALGLCIIGGNSGSKKTWAALDLALEASRGGIWLGHPTTKTTVYYVDAEMSQQSLGKRVRDLCLGKGMSLDGADLVFKSSGAMNLKDERCLEGLKADIRKHKVGMLVIDPLVSMVANFSENSARDVAKVFKILKALADEFNLVVVVVDHHTKAGTELRGCGAKKGYADTVLAISKTSNGRSEMVIKKNRHWGNEDQVVTFELSAKGGGLRLRVTERQLEQQSTSELRLVQDLTPMILNKLAGGHGISRKEIVVAGTAQGYSLKKVDAALRQLEAAGKISKQKDTQSKKRGNRAFIYHLPSAEVGYQEAA
jgi:site-specific DNA-methyltransferase (adenine-specific)